MNTFDLNHGAPLYVGKPITPLVIKGNGGVKFESDLTPNDENGIGYYYFSDNLPRGLKIAQPTIEKPYGRLTGAFQQLSSGSFIVSVQDHEGTIAQCAISYAVTKTALSFTKFPHFDYGDLPINRTLPPIDFSVGVYGGIPPYTYSVDGSVDDWANLQVQTDNGQCIVMGQPKRVTNSKLAFTLTVMDADNHVVTETIYTGKIYNQLTIKYNNEVLGDNDSIAIPNVTNLYDTVGPIYIDISGGKPFAGKLQYKIAAKNVPNGISITYGTYKDNNSNYIGNCKISGSCNSIPQNMEIEVSDTVTTRTIPITFSIISQQLSFNPNKPTELVGSKNTSYQVSISLSELNMIQITDVDMGYFVTTNNNEKQFQHIDAATYGLSALTHLIWRYIEQDAALQFLLATGDLTVNTLELNVLQEGGFNTVNYVLADECLQFNPDTNDGGNTLVISQDGSDEINAKLAEAKKLGQIYLKITGENGQVLYYPIFIGDVYPLLEWKIGFEKKTVVRNGETITTYEEIEKIYINKDDLYFTTEEETTGKLVKIFLVKQNLLRQDPIAQSVLDRLVPGDDQIYRFQKTYSNMALADIFRPDNNISIVSDTEKAWWRAWAKQNLDVLDLTAAQVDEMIIEQYLYDLFMSCGYIYGGKPPYTISLNQTTVTSNSIEDLIKPFKIVQNEDGRELTPEELHFVGLMQIAQDNTTPTGLSVSLVDMLSNSVIKEFPEQAEQTVEAPKIELINSLEESELINGHTRFGFQGWPFLKVVLPQIDDIAHNITCRWKDEQNGYAEANAVKYDLIINQVNVSSHVAYFTLAQSMSASATCFQLTESELQELTSGKDFKDCIVLLVKQNDTWTPLSDVEITGSFTIPNIVNVEYSTYASNVTIMIPESTWGSEFTALVKSEISNDETILSTVTNPVFEKVPSAFTYTDVNNGLSNLGLSLDSSTGVISGTFKLPTNASTDYYEELHTITVQAVGTNNLITPVVQPNTGQNYTITIDGEDIVETQEILVQLIMTPMDYKKVAVNYPEMVIPHIVISNINSFRWDLNRQYPGANDGVGATDRFSGGVGSCTWTFVKQPIVQLVAKDNTGKQINRSYNLFEFDTAGVIKINSDLVQLDPNILSTAQEIEPTQCQIRVTDTKDHIQDIFLTFYGTINNAANYSLTPLLFDNAPIRKFVCDRTVQNKNFKAFTIYNSNNKTKVILEDTIHFLDFINGYSNLQNLEINFIENQKISQGKGYYTLTKSSFELGGVARKTTPTSISVIDTIQIVDKQIQQEMALQYSVGYNYDNNGSNSTIQFTIEYQFIGNTFNWKQSFHGRSANTSSIDLSELITGSGVYFYFQNKQPSENGELGVTIDMASLKQPRQGSTNASDNYTGNPHLELYLTNDPGHRYTLEINAAHQLYWKDENGTVNVPTFPIMINIVANYFNRAYNTGYKGNTLRFETVAATILFNNKQFWFYNWWTDPTPSVENNPPDGNQPPSDVVYIVPDGEITRTSYDDYQYDYMSHVSWSEITSWKSKTIIIDELVCNSKCIINLTKLLPLGAGAPPYSYAWSNIGQIGTFDSANISAQLNLTVAEKSIVLTVGAETSTTSVGRSFQFFDSQGEKVTLTIKINKIRLPLQLKSYFTNTEMGNSDNNIVNSGDFSMHSTMDRTGSSAVTTNVYWFLDRILKQYITKEHKKLDGRTRTIIEKKFVGMGTNIKENYQSQDNQIETTSGPFLQLNWMSLLNQTLPHNTYQCFLEIPRAAQSLIYRLYAREDSSLPTIEAAHGSHDTEWETVWQTGVNTGHIVVSTNTLLYEIEQPWITVQLEPTKVETAYSTYGANEQSQSDTDRYLVLHNSAASSGIPYVTLHIYYTQNNNTITTADLERSFEHNNLTLGEIEKTLIPNVNYCQIDIPLVCRRGQYEIGRSLRERYSENEITHRSNGIVTKFCRLPLGDVRQGNNEYYALYQEDYYTNGFNDDYLYLKYVDHQLQDIADIQPVTYPLAILSPYTDANENLYKFLIQVFPRLLDFAQTQTVQLRIAEPLAWRTPIIYKNKAGKIVKVGYDAESRGLFKFGSDTSIDNLDFQLTCTIAQLKNDYTLYLVKKPAMNIDWTLVKIDLRCAAQSYEDSRYVWVSPVESSFGCLPWNPYRYSDD